MGTRIATVAITGIRTSARWVERFDVQCYSDDTMNNLVGSASTPAVWDGSYNWQQNYISFGGLTFGTTYYFRVGVVTPFSFNTVWSDLHAVQAGDATKPTSVYNHDTTIGSPKYAPGSVSLYVVVTDVPANIDHYEVVWNYDGSIPASTARPFWTGGWIPGTSNKLFVSAPVGRNQYVTLWIRAVNTWQNAQDWIWIGAYGSGTADDVSDGQVFGVVNVLDRSQLIPTWMGGIDLQLYPNDIKMFWSSLKAYRSDGTYAVVPDRTLAAAWDAGGLTAATQYFFYPFYDWAANMVYCVNDSETGGGGAGNVPKWAFPSASSDARRKASIRMGVPGRSALSSGGMSVTTLAVGGGTSYGGIGGGDGCPRVGMLVESRTRGVVPVENIKVGEEILGPSGWRIVLSKLLMPCRECMNLVFRNGEELEQSPSTVMPVEGNPLIKLRDVNLNTLFYGRDDQMLALRRIEYTEDDAYVAVIQLDGDHLFYCGRKSPSVVTHNILSRK